MHVGCLELIANDRVRSMLDLKGKRAAIADPNGITHLLLMLMAAYVGLDPAKDIEWVTSQDPLQMLADGKIDAFLGTPPQPQMARERNIGHVILNTAVDRPWAQYYCCMLAASTDYAQRYPVATKRSCGRCSRPSISAFRIRSRSPGTSWRRASPTTTTTPSRP